MHPNSRESLRPPTVPLGPTHIPSSLCSSLTSPSTARAGGPGRYLFSAVTPLDSRCRVSPGLLSCPLHPPPRRPSHRWGAGAPASIAAVGGNPALETGRRCCQKWKQEPLPCHPPLPPGPDPTRLQLFPVSSFFENGTGSWGNDCCHLPITQPLFLAVYPAGKLRFPDSLRLSGSCDSVLASVLSAGPTEKFFKRACPLFPPNHSLDYGCEVTLRQP